MKSLLFLSHDISDMTPAVSVRRLLELNFRTLEVYSSGINPDSDIPLEVLRSRLRHADLVVGMMSRRGIGNPRLYFEAGAGCVGAGTSLLLMDGVKAPDLEPPLNRLPKVNLDEQGLHQLITTVANATGMAVPQRPTAIDETLWNIKSFLQLRNSEEDMSHRPGFSSGEKGREPVDKAIASLYKRLREHLRQATVASLMRSGTLEPSLNRDQLKALPLQELFVLARKLNVPVPEYERSLLLTFEQDIPIETSPRWKKMNACKLLEGIDDGVRRFEKVLEA